MKLLVYIFVLILFYSCTSKKPISKQPILNNMGYSKVALFVYNVIQKDSFGKLIQTDTLGLFCNDNIDSTGKTSMQWKYLSFENGYKLSAKKDDNTITSIVSNDTCLFIHPPRFGNYKILQFCPYPFFYNNRKTWDWQFEIGSIWSLPEYPVTEIDTFNIKYTQRFPSNVHTAYGELLCGKVDAVSKSKYGNSYASFYLSNEFGIVHFTMMPINKTRFEFYLLHKAGEQEAMQVNKYFYKTRTQKLLRGNY